MVPGIGTGYYYKENPAFFNTNSPQILPVFDTLSHIYSGIQAVNGKKTCQTNRDYPENREEQEETGDSDEDTGDESEETSAGVENDANTDLQLEDRETAPYGYWLSAAILTGISIEYPAFESGEVYTSGETELDDKDSGSGVYITFYVDGQEKCIYGEPLEAERSNAGTKDIYSDVIGFASFDEVNVSEIPGEFSVVNIDNMNELIRQSVTVMLYEH